MRVEQRWATVVAVTFLAIAGNAVASDPNETMDELKRCARIADPPSRFACYEALGQRVLEAEAPAVTEPLV